MMNGGLAEVTCIQIEPHRIAVKMGKHRIFDIVDDEDGEVAAMHKNSGSDDSVYANPQDLLMKLNDLLQKMKNR